MNHFQNPNPKGYNPKYILRDSGTIMMISCDLGKRAKGDVPCVQQGRRGLHHCGGAQVCLDSPAGEGHHDDRDDDDDDSDDIAMVMIIMVNKSTTNIQFSQVLGMYN